MRHFGPCKSGSEFLKKNERGMHYQIDSHILTQYLYQIIVKTGIRKIILVVMAQKTLI